MSAFLRTLQTSVAGVVLLVAACAQADGAKTAAPAQGYQLPSSLAGDFLSGEFAREHGDQEGASAYLKDALAKDPDNSAIAGQLLVLSLMSGDMPTAINRSNALEGFKGHEPLADLVLAVSAVDKDHLEEAEKRFHKVFYFSEKALWPQLFAAWVQAGQGTLKKPVRTADLLGEGQSVPAFLAYQVALVNENAGFDKVAGQQFDLAVSDHARTPFRAVQAAADFYRRHGDKEKLSKLKADYLSSHPDASALVNSEDASHLLEIMSQKTPEQSSRPLVGSTREGVAEVLFTMASVLYSADAPQDTQIYLRMALYLRPDFPLAQLLLASVLEDSKRYAEAAQVYSSVNPKSGLYERALLRQAFVLQEEGKPDAAIAMLDARAAAVPDDYQAYVAKGDLFRSRNMYQEAADAYTQAIGRIGKPDDQQWEVFFARGVCLERLNQWDKAEADLRQAIALSPEQPEVLNYLGYSLLTRNQDFGEARQMIEKAYSLQPDAAYIVDSLGWALYKGGDAPGAVTRLEQAIEQMPDDATVNEHLGDAYWQVGRKTEARYQWQRALAFSPEADQEKEIRQKLKDGLAPITPTVAPPAKGARAQRNTSAITD